MSDGKTAGIPPSAVNLALNRISGRSSEGLSGDQLIELINVLYTMQNSQFFILQTIGKGMHERLEMKDFELASTSLGLMQETMKVFIVRLAGLSEAEING